MRARQQKARRASAATVHAALAAIPPSIERERWLEVCMALKSFFGDAGFEVCDAWSSGDAESYDSRRVKSAWRSLKAGGRTTVGTLLKIAQDHGFDLAAQYAREDAAERAGLPLPSPVHVRPVPTAEELLAAERAAAEERDREQRAAAKAARRRWERAEPLGTSPYLERKGVSANGCRFERGGLLLVPMLDAEGELWSVQSIAGDGTKRFPKGGRVKGLRFWIGDPAGAEVRVLAEGFATAATIHDVTGLPVAVTFNAGNLVEVARQFAEARSHGTWLVAADDDRDTERRCGRNPGRDAASEAAALLAGRIVIPEGLPEGGTDFNDMAAAHGPASIAVVFSRAVPGACIESVGADARQGAQEGAHGPRLVSGGGGQGKGPGGPRKGRGGPPDGPTGDPPDAGPRDPFFLAPDGVYHRSQAQGGEVVNSWICAPIEVLGESRNLEGFEWGKLVRFTNRDGEQRTWVLKADLFAGDGVELRKTLALLGLAITPKQAYRNRLVEYFETRNVLDRVRTVGVTGWTGSVFVLPGETIGAATEPIVYHSPGDPGLRLERRGTIEGWRREIARRCVGNSRLTFAASFAFAAPMLAMSGEKNGGFHLRGTSQDGKTTSLQVAASVYSAPSYVRKWRTTDNATEAVAALHSDLPLLLDEVHQCSPRVVGDVAYLLAEGQGKARGERTGGLRSILRWRTLFLSTGETGLAEYMATADVKATAGQEMRVAEITAAPERGFGVFEDLHGEDGGEAFALRLRDAVAAEYGTAGRAWLEWLVANHDQATIEVQRLVRRFADAWTPEGAAGQVASVARRFALVAAAGELATRAGITGWVKGTAAVAAKACFDTWIEVRGGAGRAEERELLRRVRAFLLENEHRFEWWDRAHDDRAPKTLNRAGFRKGFHKGSPIESQADRHVAHGDSKESVAAAAEHATVDFYIFKDTFRKEVLLDTDHRFAHKVLIERGVVKTEKNGPTTRRPYRRERLPGSGGSLSPVYVINSAGRAALEEALAHMGG